MIVSVIKYQLQCPKGTNPRNKGKTKRFTEKESMLTIVHFISNNLDD